MRYILILILLLLINGCAIKEQTNQIEMIAPLAVNLYSDVNEGIIKLEPKLFCNAIGGKLPYSYSWKLNKKSLSCNESCSIEIDEIGNHSVVCKVTDSKGNISSDSILLRVEKKKILISQIISFGDSLTYGYGLADQKDNWISLYSAKFEKAKVYNYAFTGAKTADILEKELALYKNDSISKGNKLVFIWIGANDIPDLLSLEQFRSNYKKIVDELVKIPDSTVIILNIPDVSKLPIASNIDEEINDFLKDFGYSVSVKQFSKEVVSSYNQVISDVAVEYNITVIDIFSYMDTFDDSMITEDNFHPNEKGHDLVMKKIENEIKAKFQEIEFY